MRCSTSQSSLTGSTSERGVPVSAKLSPEEREEVKKVARHLLQRVRAVLVLDWRKRAQARARVRMAIEETLDDGRPRAYTPQLFEVKCSTLFDMSSSATGIALRSCNAGSRHPQFELRLPDRARQVRARVAARCELARPASVGKTRWRDSGHVGREYAISDRRTRAMTSRLTGDRRTPTDASTVRPAPAAFFRATPPHRASVRGGDPGFEVPPPERGPGASASAFNWYSQRSASLALGVGPPSRKTSAAPP
jgi:restriction endonuclease HindI-like protein